ncbi:MAG TPA: SNF2-related protein, partial [Ideonella sp.]|nr:SNF2-related protein [Ideonella sp.]
MFAAIALRDLRDGSEYTLDLRSATPGDNRCSCAAWRSALSGQCEHLAFVLAQLAADSETAAVLEHGWQPLHSEVFLRYGARRSLRWLAGSICPEPLEQAALALLDPRGDLRLDDGAALPALLRLADEVGQELRVDESVWTHLAHQRDAANRVLRLEQAYPEGPSSAALQSLLTLPLRPYQIEGALFAAVAGHALLADDDGLGKTVQAVAATELLIRQFGVERVLVACEAAQQSHWQQALQELAGRDSLRVEGDAASRAAHYADAAPIKIADLATLRQDRAGLAAFNPELVIVDEARDEARAEQPFDFAVLDGLGAPYALLITRTPLEERPQDLLPRVLWLDPYRLGTSARFLRQHVKRSAGGEIAGIAALEQLDTTLRHVMLRRTRDQVSAQLP